MLKLFRKQRITSVKIDQSMEMLLDLEAAKKRLEIELSQIKLELDNQKKREAMRIEEESHKNKLELLEKTAIFERERKLFDMEKKELEDRLKKEFELKTQESIILTRLEAQQQVKQTELDKDRALNMQQSKFNEELSKIKIEMSDSYYKKLTESFQEIQLNGDKNTKFVQELALKVFDRIPSNHSKVNVDVNTQPLALSANNGES